ELRQSDDRCTETPMSTSRRDQQTAGRSNSTHAASDIGHSTNIRFVPPTLRSGVPDRAGAYVHAGTADRHGPIVRAEMTHLSPAVYESILDVLGEAAAAESASPFPEEVAAALRRALGCDAVAYWERTQRDGIIEESVDADDRDSRLRVWQRYPL